MTDDITFAGHSDKELMTIMARRHVEVPRQVRVLAAARAVNQLGAFSLAFLTVMMCRVLGASMATAGAVSALFGLATIPSRLLGGRLADRLGQRRTILTGLTGCAAAQLGIAAAPDLAVAAGCAILLGLAFELYEPPSQAMIAEATEPGQRTHAYALLTTALAVGNMGAGLIADAVGHSGLRWLFVVDAASCLACALIVRLALPAGDRRPASQLQPPSPDESLPVRFVASPWRDPRLLAMTAAGTMFALVYMLILVALPLSLSARGLNPASAGLVMATATLTLVVTRPVLRIPLVAGLSGQVACGAGFALMSAGLAGYAIAHSLAGLLAPTAIWSAGNLLLSGRAFAVVTALAPPGAAARYLAVYGLSWGIATVAAPVLATQAIGSLGTAALWSGCAVLCAAMSCGQPALMRVVSQAGASDRSDGCNRDHDKACEQVQVACDQLRPSHHLSTGSARPRIPPPRARRPPTMPHAEFPVRQRPYPRLPVAPARSTPTCDPNSPGTRS